MGIRCLILATFIAPLAGIADDTHPELREEIEKLEAAVKESPRDADLKLHLALTFWRAGRTADAYRHAKEVVDLAPNYIDAHLLLARIDGISGRFDLALWRVNKVLKARPRLKEALKLKASLYLWSGRHEESGVVVDRLAEIDDNADVRYRRAQIAYDQMNYVRAYRHAREALEMDQGHKQAETMKVHTRLVQVDLASALEIFPSYEKNKRLAYGQTLVAAVLPRNLINGAVDYDYHHRFATHNHRFGLRLNWRPTKALTLSIYGRLGLVEVLPWLTVFGEIAYAFDGGFAIALLYTYDRMVWPGELSRIRASGVLPFSKKVRLEPAFELGVLTSCGEVASPTFGPRARLVYANDPFETYLQYAYGMELGRSEIVASDYCPGSNQSSTAPSAIPTVNLLNETTYHDVAIGLQYKPWLHGSIRGGYGVQFRNNDTQAHMLHLAYRHWF
ncbi:MAG: hypothetical protein GY854_25910 [Deltaproteobacteria bacterium]|nr:hypothetical protein [Deltaproteobacteria bacterium]